MSNFVNLAVLQNFIGRKSSMLMRVNGTAIAIFLSNELFATLVHFFDYLI
uniref:Uncharacterized protein n=1 Tax=Heterorhabditis bacteriophora TaxID=37862 RepID=A0A1I7WPN9_HETBA